MVEGNRDPERFSVDIEENAHETGNRLLEECNHSTANQFQSERATRLINAPSIEQFHSRTAIQKPSEIQLPQFDFVDNGIIEFAEKERISVPDKVTIDEQGRVKAPDKVTIDEQGHIKAPDKVTIDEQGHISVPDKITINERGRHFEFTDRAGDLAEAVEAKATKKVDEALQKEFDKHGIEGVNKLIDRVNDKLRQDNAVFRLRLTEEHWGGPGGPLGAYNIAMKPTALGRVFGEEEKFVSRLPIPGSIVPDTLR